MKTLLKERIAQLENGEAEPSKSVDERAADENLEGASAAVRQIVADDVLSVDEKLRVLQSMYTDYVADVRVLEYDLGLEEKRLSVAELDYGELGEDLRKVDLLTAKLKTLSRELSKQNKAIMEESERRTAEEREKREEIVSKFDEAMSDIHSKLNSQDTLTDRDELVESLESELQHLQQKYDEREQIFEEQLSQDEHVEANSSASLTQAEDACTADQEALANERRILRDLEQKDVLLSKRVAESEEAMESYQAAAQERQAMLKKHTNDLEKWTKNVRELGKTKESLQDEAESLKAKSAEAAESTRHLDTDLEFWKSKAKSEREKREKLERVCRSLTEERTVMRKEVEAMQAAWVLLETEIESLRAEISGEPESSASSQK